MTAHPLVAVLLGCVMAVLSFVLAVLVITCPDWMLESLEREGP